MRSFFCARVQNAFCARHAVSGEKAPVRLLDGGDDVPAGGDGAVVAAGGADDAVRADGNLIAVSVRLRRLPTVVHDQRTRVPHGVEIRDGQLDGKGQVEVLFGGTP